MSYQEYAERFKNMREPQFENVDRIAAEIFSQVKGDASAIDSLIRVQKRSDEEAVEFIKLILHQTKYADTTIARENSIRAKNASQIKMLQENPHACFADDSVMQVIWRDCNNPVSTAIARYAVEDRSEARMLLAVAASDKAKELFGNRLPSLLAAIFNTKTFMRILPGEEVSRGSLKKANERAAKSGQFKHLKPESNEPRPLGPRHQRF